MVYFDHAGPTDSNKAKSEAPKSIRGLFGTDGTQNAVHGSDCTENADVVSVPFAASDVVGMISSI